MLVRFALMLCLLLATGLLLPLRALAAAQWAVIDVNGRFIIPLTHNSISYLGSGVYMESSPAPALRPTNFINSRGENVFLKLPPDSTVDRVFPPIQSFGDTAPSPTLIFFTKGEYTGVADIDGRVIVQPKYGLVAVKEPGVFRVDESLLIPSLNIKLDRWPRHIWGHVYLGEERLADESKSLSVLTDLTLKPVCQRKFDYLGDFKNGTAIADCTESGVKFCCLIDRGGTIVKRFPKDITLGDQWAKSTIIATKEIASGKYIYGLVDRRGNFVLPCEMKGLRWAGNHLLSIDSQGQANILNEDGKIALKCPDHTQDIWMNESPLIAVGIGSEEYTRKPTIELKYGYMDFQGKMAIFPRFSKARWFHGDWAAAAEKSDGQSPEKFGIIDKNGEWKVLPQFYTLVEGAPGQYIALYATDKFNTEMWLRENSMAEIDRVELFDFLLREYNLIGMPQEKVERLLGEPKLVSGNWVYILRGKADVAKVPILEIAFDGDKKVRGYRCPYLETFDEGPWFEHDMKFGPGEHYHAMRGRLKPKLL